jgi:hypothetical protein
MIMRMLRRLFGLDPRRTRPRRGTLERRNRDPRTEWRNRPDYDGSYGGGVGLYEGPEPSDTDSSGDGGGDGGGD